MTIISLFFSALFSLSALCQSNLPKTYSGNVKDLLDKEWVLFKLDDLFIPPPIDSYTHLIFYKDSAISVRGNTGCNELKAIINLKGNQISFTCLNVDSVKCLDPQEAELEETLVRILKQANKWKIVDKDFLYINKDNKTLVIFMINRFVHEIPPTKEN